MTTLTFAQALLQAEAQARSTLPVELHERLSCAISLVKDGRVFQTRAGDWQVDSASTEGLVYSVNGSCSCQDAQYNKPAKGLCKHRIAMFLSQRAMALMQQPPVPVGPAVVLPGAMEAFPMNDPEPTPRMESVLPMSPLPAGPTGHPLAALPEAPCSANVHVTIAGRDVLVTLRDTDEARLLIRLEELLQRYPLPPPAAPRGPRSREAGPGQESGWCQHHGVEMTLNNKQGRQWWSHRTADGRWCKGKGVRP